MLVRVGWCVGGIVDAWLACGAYPLPDGGPASPKHMDDL